MAVPSQLQEQEVRALGRRLGPGLAPSFQPGTRGCCAGPVPAPTVGESRGHLVRTQDGGEDGSVPSAGASEACSLCCWGRPEMGRGRLNLAGGLSQTRLHSSPHPRSPQGACHDRVLMAAPSGLEIWEEVTKDSSVPCFTDWRLGSGRRGNSKGGPGARVS